MQQDDTAKVERVGSDANMPTKGQPEAMAGDQHHEAVERAREREEAEVKKAQEAARRRQEVDAALAAKLRAAGGVE